MPRNIDPPLVETKPDLAPAMSHPLLLTDRQAVTDIDVAAVHGQRHPQFVQEAGSSNQGSISEPNALLPARAPISDYWSGPAVIAANNFVNKSLSSWNLNTTVGCAHGCRFCYVPSVSTNKLGVPLLAKGVDDPDADWGGYVFVRPWDERKFLASLAAAEATPHDKLSKDGNRAIMLATTTDPYQVIRNSDRKKGQELTAAHDRMRRRALELILTRSTLNVRILTRGPQAKFDFDLFKRFGNRLLFGMSLPTLRDDLAKIYEPHAPPPSQRLKTLQAAQAAGLPVYVAVAPAYPECDEADLRATFLAVRDLDPVTVFEEPINIRAENVKRIRMHAEKLGVELLTEVFDTTEACERYSIGQLKLVERIAGEVGLGDRLHLWPDKSLGTKAALARAKNPEQHQQWLNKWWSRVSEWLGKTATVGTSRESGVQLDAVPAESGTSADGGSMRTRHPDEFLAMKFDPADNYLDNGIFAKRQVTTLVGPPGIGKSMLLLMFAACTILGRDFFGLKVNAKKLKWLIIQQENGDARLKADFRRLRAWVGEKDWPLVNECLVVKSLGDMHAGALDLRDPGTFESLCLLARKEKADAVAFDPMGSFGGGLNTDDGMRKIYDRMVEIARQGNKDAAVLIAHHTTGGKAGTAKAVGYDRGIYGRGSKALLACTRGQINVAPASEHDNERVVISCGKNSNGPEFAPVGLRLNEETHLYEIDPDFDLENWKMEMTGRTDKRPKFGPKEVAELVREHSLSSTDLVQQLMEVTKRGKSTAYNLIVAAKDQTIRLNKDGEYVPV